MNQIAGVTDLQRNFKRMFDHVTTKKSALVLTRKSKPEAVLLPYDEYVRLVQLSESEVTARFDRIMARMRAANARFTDDEVEADLAQASRTTRARRPANKANARRR